MLIFAYRLFNSMKSYKKHIIQLRQGNFKAIVPESELELDSKASKSVGYLSFVFLNVAGGFLIWFHIILFLVIICNLFVFHGFTLQIHRLELISSFILLITPVLVLCGLKKFIPQWLSLFTTSDQSTNVDNNFYLMVVCLTFIFSTLLIIKLNRIVRTTLLYVRLSCRCCFLGFSSDQRYLL